MRRALTAILVGGALLSASACGTASGRTPGGAGTPVAASAGVAANAGSAAKTSCEALGDVYNKNIAPFAAALTKLTEGGSDKDAKHAVETTLTAFAGAVRTATEDSTDPQIVTDGKHTADLLKAKATDATFLGGIKTSDDVNKALGPTLKEWLSPVAHHCS